MAPSQGTIDEGTRLKLYIRDLAENILAAKSILEATTFDNIRNRHNTAYEGWDTFYTKTMMRMGDTPALMAIMDFDEEFRNIAFVLENAVANAEAAKPLSTAAQKILQKTVVKKAGFSYLPIGLIAATIIGVLLAKR